MRVLHVFKTYYPDSFGGVERTIHAIAKGSLAHGIRSDVLSLSRAPDLNTLEVDGHTAYKAKLDWEFSSTGLSRQIFSKFRELIGKADVVHYHFPWPMMDLLHISQKRPQQTLVTYHSDIVKQKALLHLYKPVMHNFLASVPRIVTTSSNYLESSALLQRYNKKTTVIPIGLEEEDYPRAPQNLRDHWAGRFPKPFFLFLGVLRYYKGLHILVEAAKHIEADILIAGSGPMEDELKRQVLVNGLTNVHFVGGIEELDKSALLELCIGLVFPSHLRSEAFGLSLVEAAMFGKPMISCEIGTGTSFVNKHGETGIVVPPGNAEALSVAMLEMVRSPEVAMKYGAEAKKRYHLLFEAKLMISRYADVYRSVISEA